MEWTFTKTNVNLNLLLTVATWAFAHTTTITRAQVIIERHSSTRTASILICMRSHWIVWHSWSHSRWARSVGRMMICWMSRAVCHERSRWITTTVWCWCWCGWRRTWFRAGFGWCRRIVYYESGEFYEILIKLNILVQRQQSFQNFSMNSQEWHGNG